MTPGQYLAQWIHENVYPTQTSSPFPGTLRAMGLSDPRGGPRDPASRGNRDPLLAALTAIYVDVASSKHTVTGRKAWIRVMAGSALLAAGVPAGATVTWDGRSAELRWTDTQFSGWLLAGKEAP